VALAGVLSIEILETEYISLFLYVVCVLASNLQVALVGVLCIEILETEYTSLFLYVVCVLAADLQEALVGVQAGYRIFRRILNSTFECTVKY
jgi:CDP-diglyceride synthetase